MTASVCHHVVAQLEKGVVCPDNALIPPRSLHVVCPRDSHHSNRPFAIIGACRLSAPPRTSPSPRFNPENVIISVQQRTPGHTFDKARHAFVPAPNAPLRAAGSGYAMLSLCWAGSEAFRLGGNDLMERRPLDRSAMDTFLEK